MTLNPLTMRKRRWYGYPAPKALVVTPFVRLDRNGQEKAIAVWVHQALVSRFTQACSEALATSRWRPRRIDSYVDRPIRGSVTQSQHAFACAWDFFDQPYPRPVSIWGPRNAPDEAFCRAFEKFGFRCGRRWRTRKDYPHIEWKGPLP